MHKKIMKRMAIVLAGILTLSNLSAPALLTKAAESTPGALGYETTYALSELTYDSSWNVERSQSGTDVKLTYADGAGSPLYGAINYLIPEDVLTAGLIGYKVSVDGPEGSSNLALKIQEEGNNQIHVVYGATQIQLPEGNTKTPVSIALMSTSGNSYEVTVKSITFITQNSLSGGAPDPSDKTVSYTPDQLNLHNRWDGSDKPAGGTITFGAKYTEYIADLPKSYPLSQIESVSVKVANQGGSICVKLYNTTQTADGALEPLRQDYNLEGKASYDFTLSGEDSLAAVAIMSHTEGEYPFSVDLVSIDVTLKETSDTPSTTPATEKVYTPTQSTGRWSGAAFTNQVSFTQQYDEYCFNLGEEFNLTDVEKVVVEVSDQTGNMAMKLCDSSKEQIEAFYGCNGKTQYTLTPTSTGKLGQVSVMSMSETEADYPYGVTVNKITVFLREGAGDTPEEDAPELGDNIVPNSCFAESDVSMWKAASGGATISAETATNEILPGISTYGMISNRTSNYECIALDVTSSVEKNKEYQFSFYAMLDAEDYANAPETQRTLQLSPMLTADGSTSYSQGVKGSYSKALTPGEWTLFTGTYTPTWTGDLESVVLRFLEQGENYGQGDGVKGRYYITDVKLQLVVAPQLSIQEDIVNLRDAMTSVMGDSFLVGTSITNTDLSDELEMKLVTKHFNAVTLGNELKPDAMFNYSNNRCPGTETVNFKGEDFVVPVLNFSRAERSLDAIYNHNQANPENQIKVRGHVMVWHSQTPEWFFHEDYDAEKPYVDPDTMAKRQEWYIKTVAEHFTGDESKYKGMFYGWDIVNEAVSDGRGTYRNDSENSSWWAVYKSPRFITDAFVFANKYLPADVELYYNDYNEHVSSKVNGIVQLLKDVKATEGARIDGMGMQGHYQTDANNPTIEQIEKAIIAYCDVVGKVQFTELDYKATSAYDGTKNTRDAEFERLAARYKELYDTVRRLTIDGYQIDGITVWGVVDKYSWLQTSSSVGGASDGTKKQCPLLFDDYYQAKPSFYALAEAGELTPVAKKVTLMQSMDSNYSGAFEYSFGKTTNVIFNPVWSADGLKLKVLVKDSTADATDAVTLYYAEGGETKQVTCARSNAKEVADGYEAELSCTLPADMLYATASVNFDLVVVNGDSTFAYSDTSLQHAETTEYFAIGILKPSAIIEKGTVTIDGDDKDAAWDKATWIPLTVSINQPTVSASAKLLWDEDYLYVLMNVEDSVLNMDSANTYEQDSIEIFIDENNHKSESYEADDKQYRINYMNDQSFNGTKCNEENVLSETKLTEKGYLMEAAFKWTDITAAGDSIIGVGLQINDADGTGKRIGILGWSDTTDQGWSSTAVYGTALLKDIAKPNNGNSTNTPQTPNQGQGNLNNEPSQGQSNGNGNATTPGQEKKKDKDTNKKVTTTEESEEDLTTEESTSEPPVEESEPEESVEESVESSVADESEAEETVLNTESAAPTETITETGSSSTTAIIVTILAVIAVGAGVISFIYFRKIKGAK